MQHEEEDKIETLRKRLYATGTHVLNLKRRALSEDQSEVPRSFETASKLSNFIGMRKGHSWYRTLFLFSLLFFVLALGISFSFFFGGRTTVSSENIAIDIEGPSTIGGGEVLPLQITVTNHNAAALELADLLVEYPEGTRSAEDLTSPLPRDRHSLGTIAPGAKVRATVNAVLFGEEQSAQEIQVTVEYRLQDSNAIFYKEKSYAIALASAPLRLSVKTLREVVAGQDITMEVMVESNATTALRNVVLVAEYPFGFTFKGANPSPSFGTSVWKLGDVSVGGVRTITIRAVMAGESEDERVVRFSAGIGSDTDEKKLVTAIVVDNETITIKKPFLAADIAVNGKRASEFVAQSGRPLRVDVTWTNNIATPVTDAEIAVSLSGSAFDRSSVSVDRGFYRSSDTTVLWNKTTDVSLTTLPAGASGTGSFTFSPLASAALANIRNPTITLTVSVRGTRVSDTNVPEAVSSSVVRTIAIASDVALASRALYSLGPFPNNGPIPPKANMETTYTIIWTLRNPSNPVSDVVVTAALPSNARFTGKQSPATFSKGESLAFNPIGGIITWSLDAVQPGAGYSLPPREVAFQVGFTPSTSQIGDIPVIIGDVTIRGFDQITKTEVGGVQGALTTNITADPSFRSGQGQVVQ